MELLIIGGTGVLSSAVAIESINRGIRVTIINRGNRKERIPTGVNLIIADKDDHSKISDALGSQSFDAIIDFLCFNEKEIEKSFSFYKTYTKQYFFISSSAVYDSRIDGIKTEESPKVNPNWKYSVDKWASEELLVKMATRTGINYTIIRPCVTYDDTRIPYGIMPRYGYHWTLIERIKNGKPVLTWNKGNNRCNMMRVEDFAVGVVGLIGNPKAFNEAFNVCGDEAPSFSEVLDVISKWLGKDIVRLDIPSSFYAKEAPRYSGEIMGGRSLDSINSNGKLKEAVPSFKQRISLAEGVELTLNAYKDHGYEKGISWEYDAQCDRIVKKWCKMKGIDSSQYCARFVDYLKNAGKRERFNYWIEKHSDKFYSKLCWLIVAVLRKYKMVK